jgi:hypothetical protein
MNNLIQRSFLNALGTVAYISLLVTGALNGEKLFGTINMPFAPMIFLTVFVLSASVTGGLVLGKPVLMYINGQKSEAIKLFIYTLCWLALALAILVTAGLLWK